MGEYKNMENTNDNISNIREGLVCLVTAAKILGIPADYQQLERAFVIDDKSIGTHILVRAAKELDMKAREVDSNLQRLPNLSYPLLALRAEGGYIVLIRADESKVLMYDPRVGKPMIVTHEEFTMLWSGKLILLARRFSLKNLEQQFNFSWFIPVILKFKRLFLEVLFFSFFLQCFGLITPLFSQVIIDKVLVHKGLTTLDVLAIGLLFIHTFEGILNVLRSYVFSHTTNRVDVILGTKLFRHMLALPIQYFETRRVGDTIARVRELENIRQFLTGNAITIILDLLFCIIFVVVMFFYSVQLSLITLIALPFFVGLSLFVTPILRKRLDHKFACNSEVQSYLVESVTGISTVKSLAIEPQFNHRWEGTLANYVKASFRTTVLSNMAGNAAQYIQKLSSLAILWSGARLVMEGSLTIGQLIAFQMFAGRVIDPVLRLANVWQDFQQVRLSIARLGDILNSPCEPMFNPNKTMLPALVGKVSVDDIVFRYRPDAPVVLDHIKFDVPAGMTIGIVGRSGSGKSTLTKLIQRMYIPEHGRILIDGIDLAQVEPAWLRRQIGVVMQESYLFNGSVRDNIAAVDPSAPMQRIVEVAKMAGAHEFILELPDGYDTNVGERGSSLSGGQKQRIAIARTLLINPKILIFDEATSALDYQSERIIQDNLREICKGRTVFIIAHRLSTVRHANQIIVLEKGKVSEMGTHQELINMQGMYYNLYRQQEGSST